MSSGTGILEVVALLAFGLILCLSSLRRHLPSLSLWRSSSLADENRPRVRFEPTLSRLAATDAPQPTVAGVAPIGGAWHLPSNIDSCRNASVLRSTACDSLLGDEHGGILLAEALLRGGHGLLARQRPVGEVNRDDEPSPHCAQRTGEANRILLVDSRDAFRTSMLLRLARSGHRVFPVARSRDAMDVISREKPALIQIHRDALIELGGKFVQRIRAVSPNVPILVHGGHPASGDVGRLKHGVDITVVASAGDDADVLATMVDCSLAAARPAHHLREVIEVRSRILSDLSYNVRSALDRISGYTDILGDTAALDHQRDTLERMRASTSAATSHLQGCAAFASGIPESTRIERVGLDFLAEQVRRLVARQVGARQLGAREGGEHQLRLTTTGPLHGSALFTDGEKLTSILSQVVAEAVRLGPTTDVNIAVRGHADRTDFVVTDGRPSFASALPRRVGGSDSAADLELGIAEQLSQSIGATISGCADPNGAMACTVSVPARLLTAVGLTLH